MEKKSKSFRRFLFPHRAVSICTMMSVKLPAIIRRARMGILNQGNTDRLMPGKKLFVVRNAGARTMQEKPECIAARLVTFAGLHRAIIEEKTTVLKRACHDEKPMVRERA